MSLKNITLRDFVIVRELELDLASGFTVLTGETGAGKSILIDALQLALGARADAHAVREGAQRADISAEFDLSPALLPWLQEAGFDAADSVLLRRTVDTQGKSRAWINGSPATVGQLKRLGDELVDIHGQHAWQSLTRPDSVLTLFDTYAGLSPQPLQGLWQQWRAADKQWREAQAAQATLQQERERLAWQIDELDKLAPGQHEWDTLNADHTRLAHAHTLLEAAQGALAALEGDESGALQNLSQAHQLLEKQAHLEPEFKAHTEVLASCLAQAQDSARSLHGWLGKVDLDPERLAELDARLAQWLSFARRYKRPPAELPALLHEWQQQRAALDAAADLAGLQDTCEQAAAAYQKEARQRSQARAQAAPQLAKAITLAMQGLGMQGGHFEVALQAAEPGPRGLEQLEFLVAGHVGSSARPIGKVASGGELSRIALAIAVTTSESGTAQTLIFDEVDAGVGGAVAETVGRLMKQLGRDRQVLAVTHLAQVAACADQHLVVHKQQQAGSTHSSVAAVQHEQRVVEIARMLGGQQQSATSLSHAKEMLEGSLRP
ncbi:MAG: DNA repair protein RecN [Burkholderiaceae bacterium]